MAQEDLSLGRRQNKILFQKIYFESDPVSIFSYENLKQINPIRKAIFDAAWANVQLVIRTANREIADMEDWNIVADVFQELGLRITETEAKKMRLRIFSLHDVMEMYLKNNNKFSFYSYFDHDKATAICRRGDIYINDMFFIKNPVWQLFILIHEFSHVTGANDNFYFKADIIKNQDTTIRELINLEIKEAIPIFLSDLKHQMLEKSRHVDYDKDFHSNADTIALYAFHLFDVYAKNKNGLKDSAELILLSQNNEPFPSLAHGFAMAGH